MSRRSLVAGAVVLAVAIAWVLLAVQFASRPPAARPQIPVPAKEARPEGSTPDEAPPSASPGFPSAEADSWPAAFVTTQRESWIARWAGQGDAAIPEIERRYRASAADLERREALAEALLEIGSAPALEAFLRLLDSETDPEAQVFIADTLRRMGSPEHLDLLADRLDRPAAPPVAQALRETIGRMAQPKNVETFAVRAVDGESPPEARAAAIANLRAMRNPAAAPALGRLLVPETPPEVGEAVAFSLGKIGTKEALLALEAGCFELPEDHDARRAALRALAAQENPALLPLLRSLAETSSMPDVGAAAAIAIHRIEAQSQIEPSQIRAQPVPLAPATPPRSP